MLDIKKELYSPHATSVIEFQHEDRLIYVSSFDCTNVNLYQMYDVSYGMLEWMNQSAQEYMYDVRQTSYRVIGMDELQKYLRNKYNIDYTDQKEK